MKDINQMLNQIFKYCFSEKHLDLTYIQSECHAYFKSLFVRNILSMLNGIFVSNELYKAKIKFLEFTKVDLNYS